METADHSGSRSHMSSGAVQESWSNAQQPRAEKHHFPIVYEMNVVLCQVICTPPEALLMLEKQRDFSLALQVQLARARRSTTWCLMIERPRSEYVDLYARDDSHDWRLRSHDPDCLVCNMEIPRS